MDNIDPKAVKFKIKITIITPTGKCSALSSLR